MRAGELAQGKASLRQFIGRAHPGFAPGLTRALLRPYSGLPPPTGGSPAPCPLLGPFPLPFPFAYSTRASRTTPTATPAKSTAASAPGKPYLRAGTDWDSACAGTAVVGAAVSVGTGTGGWPASAPRG